MAHKTCTFYHNRYEKKGSASKLADDITKCSPKLERYEDM